MAELVAIWPGLLDEARVEGFVQGVEHLDLRTADGTDENVETEVTANDRRPASYLVGPDRQRG